MVGHIVGSSDRLNSILIPESFMHWANKTYGYATDPLQYQGSYKNQRPLGPQAGKIHSDRQWKTNTDKTRFSRIRVIVNWIVGIVGGIGLVMLLFGMLVFSLFIQLTIASSKNDIELLKTLGLSPRMLRQFLMRQFMPVNGVVLVTVLLVLSGLQWVLHQVLAQQMFISPWLSPVTLVATAMVLLLILAHQQANGKQVSQKLNGKYIKNAALFLWCGVFIWGIGKCLQQIHCFCKTQ